MYNKCQRFISGLHILARNRIPESIIHGDVLSNILLRISDHVRKSDKYRLLYGTKANPYYSLVIATSFIMNNKLYITIILPLWLANSQIMSLYSMTSYYIPVNMSDYKEQTGSYSKLQVISPYLLIRNDKYAYLDYDFE